MTLFLLLACGDPASKGHVHDSHAHGDSGHADSAHGHDSASSRYREMEVLVTLDGRPVEDALVTQPGTTGIWETGADGVARVRLDLEVQGSVALAAAHPAARIGGDELSSRTIEEGSYQIDLLRYDRSDNPDYVFAAPGDPEDNESTEYCAHCHISIAEDWAQSVHRRSASNPRVQDLYAGVAAAWTDEASCAAAGGSWKSGLEPGTGLTVERCYVGDGVLPALNEGCGGEGEDSCDSLATEFGGCADCHAPAIDGELGGRSLLEATGTSYDAGVHCDLCHKVERVDLDSRAPGVSGRLGVMRPAEESPSPAMGIWWPLTFGPYPDVLNPIMGAVDRSALFTSGELCAGCHEHVVEAGPRGVPLDAERWPEGLPIQSTYTEWSTGGVGPGVACQACHMPTDPTVLNAADLGHASDTGELPLDPNLANGWVRPTGAVRRHTWFGPRSAEQAMVDLAAGLSIEAEQGEELLTVWVETRNLGAGHAIPTGDPMRSMLLLVEARCDGLPLEVAGGDLVDEGGGALERRRSTEAWELWPGAEAGQRLRVLAAEGWRDYEGPLRFGDGSFAAEQKGRPAWARRGEVTILSVGDMGEVELDQPLPPGDLVLRLGPEDLLPEEGDGPATWAGFPGFNFQRVLADAEGRERAPQFLAVDIASDTRLMPGAALTTEHRYLRGCDDPEIIARLMYRPWPLELATERGWPLEELMMASETRLLSELW